MYKSIMPLLCVTELQFIRFATRFRSDSHK